MSTVSWRSDPRLVAWHLVLETYDLLVDMMGEELRTAMGFDLTWYDVLLQLSEAAQGQLTMSELAEAALVSRSGLTRIVDRMEDAGLVERRRSSDDRRVVYVLLTTLGRGTLRAAWPLHRRNIEQHFSAHLTEAEARTIIEALSRVVDASRSGD